MIKDPTEGQLKSLSMIIYMIINTINSKKYIGKSKWPFFSRYRSSEWWKHVDNIHLLRSIEKYGHENFKVSILIHGIEYEELLCELEQVFIKYYDAINNGYNCSEILDRTRKSKPYILYDNKLEKEITVTNIEDFCAEHNLSSSTMRALCKGKNNRKRHGYFTRPGTKLIKWKLLSPDNIEYIIIEGFVPKFCREHSLHHGGISALCRGKLHTFKDWVCLNHKHPRKKIYKIISPTGEIFEIKQGKIGKFCEKYNLSRSGICNITCGIAKSYKGWKLLN